VYLPSSRRACRQIGIGRLLFDRPVKYIYFFNLVFDLKCLAGHILGSLVTATVTAQDCRNHMKLYSGEARFSLYQDTDCSELRCHGFYTAFQADSVVVC
jgi:hypothetical protein